MKKIVNFRQYVSFDNGKTFQDTSIWNHIFYREPTEVEIEVLETFELAYDYIKENNLINAENGTTFFRGRKQIHISTIDPDCRKTFTKKNFKPIIVKSVMKEDEEISKISMRSLASILSADEFCEWLSGSKIGTLHRFMCNEKEVFIYSKKIKKKY